MDRNEERQFLFRLMCRARPIMTKNMSMSHRGEAFVMRYLFDHGTGTPGELAETTGNSPARISAILKALETKGWVSRTVDPHNRRRVVVALTDEGFQFIDSHRKAVDDSMEWVFDHMGSEKSEEFLMLMAEFLAYLSLRIPGQPAPDESDVADLYEQRHAELTSPLKRASAPHPTNDTADSTSSVDTENSIER